MLEKSENIVKNLSGNDSESAIIKIKEIEKDIKLYREVLECL